LKFNRLKSDRSKVSTPDRGAVVKLTWQLGQTTLALQLERMLPQCLVQAPLTITLNPQLGQISADIEFMS
jgi:hypothetical protein